MMNAILKFGLVNIRLVVTRIGIYAIAFVLVLGIPIGLFFLDPYSLAGLLVGITCFILAFITLIYATTKLHYLMVLFNLACCFWGIGAYIVGSAKDSFVAVLGWRVAYIGGLFIGYGFYHLVAQFCNLERKWFLRIIYAQGIVWWFLNIFSDSFVSSNIRLAFGSLHYHQATLLFTIFLCIWVSIVISAFIELFRFIKKSRGIKRTQGLYIFFAFLIGFLGGCSTLLPIFGIDMFYPHGNFTIIIYTTILTYAILKYQLIDIKIVFTRVGIFLSVYTLVLGIPFGLVIWGKSWLIYVIGENWFWVPMTTLLVLATVGPFIYLYIQRKTEDALLAEQRRYQTTLRQASAGMGRVKDLKKLLNLIVYVVTRAVRIEHALAYVHDDLKNQFILGAFKRRTGHINFVKAIPNNSPLADYLIQTSAPIIYEEIKQRVQDHADKQLKVIEKIVAELDGALVFPVLIDKKLLAIIVLGKKESEKLYGEDDLSVFSILANQAALAIENAKFYEDMQKTQAQLFQAEKMATIGTMADGLSHQINNRFHALGFISGDALDTIKLNKNEPMSDKVKEAFVDLERAFIRVQENVIQGGEVVQGLLKYTRKGDAGFTAVDFDQVFKSALEMAQFKIKTNELKIIRAYDQDTPKIKGNATQLQEVFFNLIDNAYDAMMQRKYEKKEPGYQPTLTVKVGRNDGQVEIIFEDNGMGVKEEDAHKLFTPFFTTKLSSKKGTGLGLYVIKKIIEDNHKGKVEMSSEHMIGTQMKFLLPIAVE